MNTPVLYHLNILYFLLENSTERLNAVRKSRTVLIKIIYLRESINLVRFGDFVLVSLNNNKRLSK